ncbi:MAG: hypothetical protein Pg6C_16470 [Treponemataceae bacterium]|nr:MAG: hypothetical protein Pg6C_16470 [Treponemataceae bacterium]
MAASFFAPRPSESHKGDFGTALVIAGSSRYFGAPVLSARAALRSGCGLCVLAAPARVIDASVSAIPEAVFCALEDDPAALDEFLVKADAVAYGMGLDQDERARSILCRVLTLGSAPLLLDADALNLIAACSDLRSLLADARRPLILTPHQGELARLAQGIFGAERDAVTSDRALAAKFAASLAMKLRAVVALKGYHTLVFAHNGAGMYRNTTGNPGLARGGSGDALSGIIVSLCARFCAPDGDGFKSALNATLCGVFLHGLAADIAAERFTQESMLPSDVIESLPAAFKSLALAQER